MIAVLSPAKTLDFESDVQFEKTKPRLFKHSKVLLETLKEKDDADLKKLMDISDQLAELNVQRYQQFSSRHTMHNSKQSLYAFQGDVYQGLQADTFDEEEVAYAQQHIRILSGLYGLLKPLDTIQPYRLEMGTNLKVNGHKNLYEFWDDKIARLLSRDLGQQGDRVVVNLASVEYFKSIDLDKLNAKIIDVEFKDFSNGSYKIISFYAKKARGMMARYIVKNKVSDVEELKTFDDDGYEFDARNSTDTHLAFIRG